MCSILRKFYGKESKFAEICGTVFSRSISREDWFWCVINRSKNYYQLCIKCLYLEGKVLVQMLTENSIISCPHPVSWGPNKQTKKLFFMFFVPVPKAGYMLREKDIYENSKDAVSIRVGWIHPANLSTSKNTKVYFLLTLLIYLWLAETQSKKSASLYFAGQCLRDKLGTLRAGVGKHIL